MKLSGKLASLESGLVAAVLFYIIIISHGIKSFVHEDSPATPSDLYLGLYSKDISYKTFTVFKRDNFQ